MIYNKETQMVFIENKYGALEPIMYDCFITNENKVSGKKILQNSIFYMFLKYVRHSSEETDKQTGEIIPGFIEIYQWKIAFEIIKNALELKSNDVIIAIARQAGKSHIVRMVAAFCLIFIPLYAKIKEKRYTVAWTSPSKRLALDHIEKLKPFIKKAVELFNMENYEAPIVTKEDDRTIKENSEILEFNRNIGGSIIEYSSLIILSLNKTVVNAG